MQINTEQLSVCLGDHPVLHEVSLSFPALRVTAIIGRSGSGKSTLLRAINGLVTPTAGRVLLDGRAFQYEHAQAERLNMGYVVQGVGLFPHLTVEKNIAIASRLRHFPGDADARVSELLARVGLPAHYRTKYPRALSGGEQQRVGICRALFLDPPVLLMDEPFSALDPITRADLQREVLRLQQARARTVVFITHDMREAQKLADHVAVLEEGSLIQAGSAAEVIQRPQHAVVRQLIEASLS
ncbi:MAG: ATP-binding cassette domain-containing protein [Cyclobacteriaceae bacterium]|nr:ATP-binding cassette domain-containing protein [Cyclobacteriaceae bacterium]